jgi:hypothetical protein
MTMMQQIVDPGMNQTHQWKEAVSVLSNKGKVSTTTVLAELQKDPALWKKYVRALRYEREVYDHGLRLHLEQCATRDIF